MPPLFVCKFQSFGQELNSPVEESLAVWWLSLDGQFRLPFNEADCALLSAFSAALPHSELLNENSVSAGFALDPRVFLIAAAGHYGLTGRTPQHLSQLVNLLTTARENRVALLEPISRHRRKLLREVQKRRERYLRHLRGGSDIWELRRQLERLLRNCGKYPGKWKAHKLINRWVTDELLRELAELNPLEIAAEIIFPSAKRERSSQYASPRKTEFATDVALNSLLFKGDAEEFGQRTDDLVARTDLITSATQVSIPSECNQEKSAEQFQHSAVSPSQFDLATFQQLLQTEKLAALRQLAYGASHEINNPLANIAMRAEMLLRGESDPERQRKLQVIRQQAMRAHEMISDLMLFANPPRPSLQLFELRIWLEQLQAELKSDIELAGGELVIEVATGMTVVGDPVQLAEAIRALVRNSLEAQPTGAYIRLVAGEDSQGAIYFDVSDNGPGISDEIARHMFDPFFSGREAGRGLGFGLPKAWRIAESHGGQLRCLDRAAGKTLFRFSWPRLQAPARAA